MYKRINITLPEDTVRAIDRVAGQGDRSRFIAQAVKHYLTAVGREQLKERLKQGAIARAQRDLELAQEGFALEEETWPPTPPRKKAK